MTKKQGAWISKMAGSKYDVKPVTAVGILLAVPVLIVGAILWVRS